jgi:hypothetical protein
VISGRAVLLVLLIDRGLVSHVVNDINLGGLEAKVTRFKQYSDYFLEFTRCFLCEEEGQFSACIN